MRLRLLGLGWLLVIGQRHDDAVLHWTLLWLLRLGLRLRLRLGLIGRRLRVLPRNILGRGTLWLRSRLLIVGQWHDHPVIDLSLWLIGGRLSDRLSRRGS